MSTSTTPERSPGTGWEKLVERIAHAPDQPGFLAALLDLQCKLVAARCGVIWQVIPGEQKMRLAAAWPERLSHAGADDPVIRVLSQAARVGVTKGGSQVLKIKEDQPEAEHLEGHVFMTALNGKTGVEAVCTVVADCRDPQVIAVTAPVRALAAGLYETFQVRQDAEARQQEAERVRKALALLGVIQEGRGFNGACLNLVNELARQYHCSRVSLGWVKGRGLRAVAMSDTDEVKRHSEQVSLLELSMAECLDQQQPLVYPLPDNAEPLLAHAVVHAHRRLTGNHAGRHALSLPIRRDDELVGVVTLERADPTADPFDPALISQVQLICDTVGPLLDDRRTADRWLPVQAWHSLEDAASYMVGPKHVAWKMAGVLLMVVALWACFGTMSYRVTADFALEAEAKRIIPMPYEARLATVDIEPGTPVEPGQVLATLEATELHLQLIEAQSKLKVHRLERTQYTAENKLAEAQQSQAALEEAQAQIGLLEHRIDAATIRSPIRGVVLSGYWHDKIGRVLEKGEPMFEVAPIDELIALVRVDESDINQLPMEIRPGQPQPTGELATRALPREAFTFRVEQIVPKAEPMETNNVFELRCRLDDPAPWLRPGMQGIAKVNAGERRIIWIATHKIIDTLRLWLWL